MNINYIGSHTNGLPNNLGVGGVNSPAANTNNNQFYLGGQD
jgi:proline racemase